MQHAIETRGLKRLFGRTEAVRGVDRSVLEGSIYAFVGPNGARQHFCRRSHTGHACS